MPEITYDALSEVVDGIGDGEAYPVTLLYGDEFLFKAACKVLLDAFVPSSRAQNSNCVTLEGTTVSIHEVVEHMQTFPLFPGPKVVMVMGTTLFHPGKGSDDLLIRTQEAFEKGDKKKAGKYFLQVLGVLDMSVQGVIDLGLDGFFERASAQGFSGGGGKGELWIGQLLDYCLKEDLVAVGHDDDADVLCNAIARGFPVSNRLVLATEMVDKRKKLFKIIKKDGFVVDCSVTKGARTADVRQQKEILRSQLVAAMGQAGKTAAVGTFDALFEKTGADLRTFNNEVEKLITFVGDNKTITVNDVEKASEKSREDPVYELANAVGERTVGKTLSNVNGLLRANLFPLQILSAVANQLRKLILAKDMVRGVARGKWTKGMNYGAFQRAVLPEFKNGSDLLIGKAHPFVIYKTLGQSENYSFEELARGLEWCLDADRSLKTTRHAPRFILEDLVIKICLSSGKGALKAFQEY